MRTSGNTAGTWDSVRISSDANHVTENILGAILLALLTPECLVRGNAFLYLRLRKFLWMAAQYYFNPEGKRFRSRQEVRNSALCGALTAWLSPQCT